MSKTDPKRSERPPRRAYDPESDCTVEAEIRAEMVGANYAGRWQAVTKLCIELNEHHKNCPVCQGVPLADLLFGQKVRVNT